MTAPTTKQRVHDYIEEGLTVREIANLEADLARRKKEELDRFNEDIDAQIARLEIDIAEDRASVVVGTEVLESIDFKSMGVDLQSTAARVRLCMNPSGFGEMGCNSFESDITITIRRGEKSSTIVIGPLGRVIKL